MEHRLNKGAPPEEQERQGILNGLTNLIKQQRKKKKEQKKKKRKRVCDDLTIEEKCDIQDIQFAYNNHKLISLLKKRGRAITNCKFDDMRSYDKAISELVKEKEAYDLLTRPVCAFITFKSDDGYSEALSYSKKLQWYEKKNVEEDFEHEMILNSDPYFTAATEPTNIIWENRHIKGINFASRVVGAMLISAFMLGLSFFLIIYFKRTEIEFKNKFPNINCDAIFEVYG